MAANGYTYSRDQLSTAGTNLGHIGDDITTAAGKTFDDPYVGASHQAGTRFRLIAVPQVAVQFAPADKLFSTLSTRQRALVDGAKKYGSAVDILSSAIADMLKNYTAVDQADQYSATQLKQSLAEAEGVPGA
jgi:hypothetical protein